MKVKMNELNEKELQEVINLWIEYRDSFVWLITLEEFAEDYVRQCEDCYGFVVLEEPDEELIEDITWKGEHIHVCQDCYDTEHREYDVEQLEELKFTEMF